MGSTVHRSHPLPLLPLSSLFSRRILELIDPLGFFLLFSGFPSVSSRGARVHRFRMESRCTPRRVSPTVCPLGSGRAPFFSILLRCPLSGRFQCFPRCALLPTRRLTRLNGEGSVLCSFGIVDWMVRPARMNESMRNFWINRGSSSDHAAPFDSKPIRYSFSSSRLLSRPCVRV